MPERVRTSDLAIAVRLLVRGHPGRGLLLLAGVSTLLVALAPSLPPYLMKRAIDDGVVRGDASALLAAAAAYTVAVAVELTVQLASTLSLATLGQRAMHRLRCRLFHHLQTLDLGYFEREPRGRVLTRITGDVEALSEMFTSGAVTMAADLLSALAIVFAMLLIDAKLTLVAFVTVPPMIVLAEVFRRQARDAFRRIRAQTAKLNSFLSEHLGGAVVIAAFSRQAHVAARFDDVSQELKRTTKVALRIDATLFAVVEAIGTTAVAAMIWYGAGDLARGLLPLGVLVAFIQYVQRFFVPIRDLSAKFTIIQSGLAAAERVEQFLAVKPALVAPIEGRRPQAALPIELAGVSFGYTADRLVLRDLSLTLEQGTKLALVGPTGSGKTTLIKLLLRLVDPSAGTLSAGGIALPEWDLGELRRRVALVPQDPIIFAGTVRENLTLFQDGVSDAALWRAAQAIGTDTLIRRLPEGLGTPLTERGANLSSGEAQLLAFTRALVQNPDLLILDEATSSIDAHSESLVQAGLVRLLEGRTAVIVAHRLATLELADRIIVLDEGEIRERGTHLELLRERGLYFALHELQFAR